MVTASIFLFWAAVSIFSELDDLAEAIWVILLLAATFILFAAAGVFYVVADFNRAVVVDDETLERDPESPDMEQP